MTAGVRQLLGLALATISFVGNIIICVLPQWRVTEFLYEVDLLYSNVTMSLMLFEGLWKLCATSSVQLTRCKRYEETLVSISQDLEVSRVLIVIAIIIGVFGILLGAAGSKFINFVPDERKRSKMAMASGVVCLITGIFVLIPIRWTTTTSINNNLDEFLPLGSQKNELGASVYIGWITTALLFLGGGLLCSSFICRDETD